MLFSFAKLEIIVGITTMLSRKIVTFVPEFEERTMKRYFAHYIYLFLGASFTSHLAGCNSSTQWNEVEFYNVEKMEQLTESPTVDTMENEDEFTLQQPKESRELDVKIDMQFLKSGNGTSEHVCSLINQQLVELLLKQSSELSIDEAIEQYIKDIKTEFHGDEVANTYYDHLKGRAEYGKTGIINYRLEEEVFTGGAHPANITTILRFSTTTGEYISLEQVVPPANQSHLKEKLLKKLMDSVQANSLEELHQKGFLELTDMFVSPNFAIREDSLEFFYNEYDIAPYAYGTWRVCLGYEEVTDLLDSTWKNRK